MEKLYKDKDDNFYGYPKEGTEPTTKEYYNEVMARKQNTPEAQLFKARAEVDAILGDMTTAEAMYYMLQYAGIKMNSNDQSDQSTDPIPTPTGEDIVSWGDRIANELDNKIRKLRSIQTKE